MSHPLIMLCSAHSTQTLGDIQIAMKVIQGGNKEEHPLDHHYKGLHCRLDPLDKGDDMVTIIEK